MMLVAYRFVCGEFAPRLFYPLKVTLLAFLHRQIRQIYIFLSQPIFCALMDLSLLVFFAWLDARARRYTSAFWHEDVCWWMEAEVFPGPHLPGRVLKMKELECRVGCKDALSELSLGAMARLDPDGERLV
jgi:hypothetical protein